VPRGSRDRGGAAGERLTATDSGGAAGSPAGATLAAHADWSVAPGKRWVSVARRTARGWRIAEPRLVGPVGSFLAQLRAEAGGGGVALGLDLPIGLPRGFAAGRTEPGFVAFLRGLSADHDFFRVCQALDELRPDRPFYPARPQSGMRRAAHAAALGLTPAAFWRACDRPGDGRRPAAAMFWTVGAQQVGKAALAAWREMLLPDLAVDDGRLRLWPFAGAFRSLIAPGVVVAAETYPAEALRQLGLRLAGSKRRQADRMVLAADLLGVVGRLAAEPSDGMARAVTEGFGADAAGEDRFDSVIGLLGLLNVLAGNRPDTPPPDDPWIARWEGWVLGQGAQGPRAP
jgi:hypothetical protein